MEEGVSHWCNVHHSIIEFPFSVCVRIPQKCSMHETNMSLLRFSKLSLKHTFKKMLKSKYYKHIEKSFIT